MFANAYKTPGKCTGTGTGTPICNINSNRAKMRFCSLDDAVIKVKIQFQNEWIIQFQKFLPNGYWLALSWQHSHSNTRHQRNSSVEIDSDAYNANNNNDNNQNYYDRQMSDWSDAWSTRGDWSMMLIMLR